MSRKKSSRRPRTASASSPGSARQVSSRHFWLLWPALWLVVAVTYAPVWHGGILWDDLGHLTRPDLRSVHGLWRIWFEIGATQQYYPAVHTAFWVFHRLWGDSTLGYHLVNITLHASSAFLMALVLRRLAVPGAILAATIFALHPVHVESVAWMSELKNLLSGVCYLSAALAYLRFDERRDWRSYSSAFVLFVVAVLSKTVAASLPAALLVVFWWRRGCLGASRDVRPLVPFFLVGIAGGLMTAWFEHTLIGARGSDFHLSVLERALVAGRVIWFYLGSLVWPARLMFIYPKWSVSQTVWWQYLYPAGVAAALAVLWRLRSTTRAPLAAALLFCGTLAPALGFIDVYPFRFSYVADHFQYLASIPLIALCAATLVTLAPRVAALARSRTAEAVLAIALGVPLAAVTWNQSRQYRDADGLLLATLAQNPACWMCHDNLALAMQARGDRELPEVVAHLQASLALNPNSPDAHFNLGKANARLQRPDIAASEFLEALRLQPELGVAHLELGVALHNLDRPKDAEVAFRRALALPMAPADVALAHYNLGLALAATDRLDQAAAEFTETLRLTPDSALAHQQMAYVLLDKGQPAQAVVHAAEAVRMDPASPEVHDALGTALLQVNRPEDAIAQYREAVRLAPDSVEYRNNLGGSLLDTGHVTEAAAEFRSALRRKPDAALVHHNLSQALGALGQLDEAAAEARAALALQPDYPEAQANLEQLIRRMRGKHP